MNPYRILWADDEIDLLKPHIIFLKSKGYDVTTVNNGADALTLASEKPFDLIILDENMPGLSGLETLDRIKDADPDVPVVMITKSEEEDIMDQAVGSKIADYLIKPVNPRQIFSSLKKLLHSRELQSETASASYRNRFLQITDSINRSSTAAEWFETYRTLIRWELELDGTDSTDMAPLLEMQKTEADSAFAKFVRRNYASWMTPGAPGRPVMSPDVFPSAVAPLLREGHKVLFVLLDNFRLDLWRAIRPRLSDSFDIEERMQCSILPTATQYARNAIFSGLMPAEIARAFPDLWVDEDAPESKNLNEEPLIARQLSRLKLDVPFSYTKINDTEGGERLLRDFHALESNALNVVVFNFIDMLSHARTDSRMIRELANTDAAYRSISLSWFRHSALPELLRRVSDAGFRTVITTDHGSIRVDRPVEVAGEKTTTTALRYKLGRTLGYNPREVFEIKRPADFGLPSPQVATAYIFATGHDFFTYRNNRSHYVRLYSGTLQHGGISLEEMLLPLIILSPKNK